MVLHLSLICLSRKFRKKNQKKELKVRRENNRNKSNSRYNDIECHYCNEIGHIRKYYFKWKKENKDKKDKQKDHGYDHVTITTCVDLVFHHAFESINFVSHESVLIIDSGATLHVTPRKEFFTS